MSLFFILCLSFKNMLTPLWVDTVTWTSVQCNATKCNIPATNTNSKAYNSFVKTESESEMMFGNKLNICVRHLCYRLTPVYNSRNHSLNWKWSKSLNRGHSHPVPEIIFLNMTRFTILPPAATVCHLYHVMTRWKGALHVSSSNVQLNLFFLRTRTTNMSGKKGLGHTDRFSAFNSANRRPSGFIRIKVHWDWHVMTPIILLM